MRPRIGLPGWALAAALLGGCAGPGVDPSVRSAAPSGESTVSADGWHPVLLPGKAPTRYAVTQKEGRWAVSARADSSASMWRRRVSVPAGQLGEARFAWWVDNLPAGAHVGDVDQEDAAARVIFAFEGDLEKLSPRNRAMFDLARALTGEDMPYATLMYVWSNQLPVGTVVSSRRTDRIRKMVIESGPAGLNRWLDYDRDVRADFERAFGEAPGRLMAVGIMTDSDNTGGSVRAWYGPLSLRGAR